MHAAEPAPLADGLRLRWALASRRERALTVVLAVATLAVVLIRLRGGHFEWMLWSDRDLVRSSVPWSSLPTVGPELSHGIGARLPGGAFHGLLAMPLVVTDEPLAIWRWQALLDTLGLAVLAWQIGRVGGPVAAAATALAWLTAEGLDDSVAKLWNPGFLPAWLALATAAWVRALAEGRGRALAWGGLALGIAGQLHASAGLAALAMLPAVLVVRPKGWVGGLALGTVGALLTYLPHLLVELRTGSPNTAALLEQTYVRAPRETFSAAHALAHAEVLVRGLVVDGDVPIRSLSTAATWAGWASAAIVLAAAAWAVVVAVRRRAPTDRVVLGAAAGLGVAALYVASDSRLDITGYGGFRYMLFAVPGFAAWVGLAARGALRGPLAAALLVAALIVGLRTAQNVPARDAYAWLDEALEVAGEALDAPLDEVVGRTVFVYGQKPGTFRLQQDDGVDFLLAREGLVHPGSRPGPCALVFQRTLPEALALPDGSARPDLGEQVFSHLPHPPTRVVGERVGSRTRVVLVDLGPMRCPTTFADRYLPTPEELAAQTALVGVPSQQAVALGPGRWALAVDVDRRGTGVDGRVELLLTLQARPSGLDVALHSNQLRGKAYNQGFFLDGLLARPILRLTEGERVVDLPLAHDLVGLQSVTTPLSHSFDLPAGAWEISFEVASVVGWLDHDDALRTLPRVAYAVPLGPVQVPP